MIATIFAAVEQATTASVQRNEAESGAASTACTRHETESSVASSLYVCVCARVSVCKLTWTLHRLTSPPNQPNPTGQRVICAQTTPQPSSST